MIKLKLCSDIRTTTKNVARQVCFKDCGRNVKGQGEVEGTLNVSIAAENVDASCGVITIGDGQCQKWEHIDTTVKMVLR